MHWKKTRTYAWSSLINMKVSANSKECRSQVLASIVEPFSQEYVQAADFRKIPLKALEKCASDEPYQNKTKENRIRKF